MKISNILGALAIGFALSFGLSTTDAQAQTQCAVGTAVGSASCAPDATPTPDTSTMGVLERVEGLGAFAFNTDTGAVYSYVLQGNSMEAVTLNAIKKCNQPDHNWTYSMAMPSEPDANCEPVSAWRNACAAVASGQVEGMTKFFSIPARNARSARAEAMTQCQSNGTNCSMAHDAVCTARSSRYRLHNQ